MIIRLHFIGPRSVLVWIKVGQNVCPPVMLENFRTTSLSLILLSLAFCMPRLGTEGFNAVRVLSTVFKPGLQGNPLWTLISRCYNDSSSHRELRRSQSIVPFLISVRNKVDINVYSFMYVHINLCIYVCENITREQRLTTLIVFPYVLCYCISLYAGLGIFFACFNA